MLQPLYTNGRRHTAANYSLYSPPFTSPTVNHHVTTEYKYCPRLPKLADMITNMFTQPTPIPQRRATNLTSRNFLRAHVVLIHNVQPHEGRRHNLCQANTCVTSSLPLCALLPRRIKECSSYRVKWCWHSTSHDGAVS